MKIAVFTKNKENPAYAAARLGAERTAARLGAQAVHYVPQQADDPAEQSALIDAALVARPDAIVLVPVHPSAVNPAIERINAARIPLVACINRLGAGECVAFVGSDDYALAFDIGRYLFERLHEEGSVVILEGAAQAVTSIARVRAFRDAAQRHPGIRIIAAASGRYLQQPARAAMAQLLAAHPRIDGVLAANDSMAIGAVEALRAAGRRALVVGVNAIPQAIEAIKSGDMLATADFDAMSMASLATECAIRHLRGEAVPKEIMLPVQLVDRGNCASWDKSYAERQCPTWSEAVKD